MDARTRRRHTLLAFAGGALLLLAPVACDMPAELDETRGEEPGPLEPDENEARRPPATERGAREPETAVSKADLRDLEDIATVEEDERIITLRMPGSGLFADDQTALSAPAHENLDRVGDSLARVAHHRSIVVEGHTDSEGEAAHNLSLSQKRADAVREHLVAQGIDATKIRAVGKGEREPIADNDTPEGRAQNRRIEIEFPRRPDTGPFALR